MKRIAKFEKVSFEQYAKDFVDCFGETEADIKEIYDGIVSPAKYEMTELRWSK